jgi:CheY-like chemotaxis protein
VGTRQLVEAAIAFGVERFVLISTDKAVNPSSVMGATKRVAERYLQTLAADLACGATVLCAVRFGNVLGSSGSVVPTFRRQIEQGGPLTITHPEVTRYFMTIPEAVQLVLRAATLAQGGDIFVLDMGEPVKIADLARDIVRLSGLELGRDIDLLFTGLRPGEKLHEELWNATEDVEPTAQDKLLVIRRPEAEAQGSARLLGQLSEMERLAKAGDTPDLIRAMRRVVPEYQPASPGLHVRRRVLVADDDAKVRETIQAVLGDLYEVSVATDGEQVLRQARAHLPDLILLDIVMPRMDGHAVCEALRSDARTRRLPIIILSALADVADKVKGLGLGADDYITKPFQIEELRARVQMVLRRAYAG